MMKLGIVVGATALVAGCVSAPPPTPQVPTTTYYRLSDKERVVISEKVKAKLKDPYSAVMGPMTAGATDKGIIYVCGAVNARNSFGGYTGMRPFIGLLGSPENSSIGFYSFGVVSLGSTDVQANTVITLCRRYGIVPYS